MWLFNFLRIFKWRKPTERTWCLPLCDTGFQDDCQVYVCLLILWYFAHFVLSFEFPPCFSTILSRIYFSHCNQSLLIFHCSQSSLSHCNQSILVTYCNQSSLMTYYNQSSLTSHCNQSILVIFTNQSSLMTYCNLSSLKKNSSKTCLKFSF